MLRNIFFIIISESIVELWNSTWSHFIVFRENDLIADVFYFSPLPFVRSNAGEFTVKCCRTQQSKGETANVHKSFRAALHSGMIIEWDIEIVCLASDLKVNDGRNQTDMVIHSPSGLRRSTFFGVLNYSTFTLGFIHSHCSCLRDVVEQQQKATTMAHKVERPNEIIPLKILNRTYFVCVGFLFVEVDEETATLIMTEPFTS